MVQDQRESLSSIQETLSALECSSWKVSVSNIAPSSKNDNADNSDDVVVTAAESSGSATTIIVTPAMIRARRHTHTAHCFSAIWKHCPSDYYSRNLEERARILGANTIAQLCKSCLMENKNYVRDDQSNDPTNSRYYLIVVQYIESIDAKKLASELRGLRPPGKSRFSPSYFSDLRLAPSEESAKLTGYGHNGVSPFGMLDPSIPIVVCQSIMKIRPRFIWMGGGHADWKLGVSVNEFVKGLNAIVLDVSEPRVP